MGCDIHGFIEYTEDLHHTDYKGDLFWWPFCTLSISRDYNLFATLSGVRDYDDIGGLIEEKGVPQDASWRIFDDYYVYVRKEGEEERPIDGYYSQKEAETYIHDYSSTIFKRGDSTYCSSPDWHDASWATAEELMRVKEQLEKLCAYENKDLEAIIAIMLIYDPLMEGKARFIYWYDN